MSFTAQRPGYCGCCGEPYEAGTEIAKVDDFYWWIDSHRTRAIRQAVEDAKPPCPRCFLIHAGECF